MPRAILMLEDGFAVDGRSFGAEGETMGEVVFNTSMTGYQEILTDPSYKGQMVVMTYPLIGNYGVNSLDVESGRVWADGFVVRELSPIASSWRAEEDLAGYLRRQNVIGIEGVDTRALTRRLRIRGSMKGVISTVDFDRRRLKKKVRDFPGLVGSDLVKEVTCRQGYEWNLDEPGLPPPQYQAAVLDCGVKRNILNELRRAGCRVQVFPAFVSIGEILSGRPDGVVLSNGPGDPAGVPYVAETTRRLLGKIPMMGICLGHQILGLALGGKTYKLKFGHHGGNQPVLDLDTKKVDITAQNHCFAVDVDSVPGNQVRLTHVNLNDRTVEGMEHRELPVFSLQYHPEASPGPHDARYLFARFIEMMKRRA